MDEQGSVFAAMAVGFVFALIAIVAALFQEGIATGVARLAAAVRPRAAVGHGRGTAAGGMLARLRATRLWRLPRLRIGWWSNPKGRPLETDAGADSQVQLIESDPERDRVDAAADERPTSGDEVLRRHHYQPASALSVEHAVRDFLADRDGRAQVEHVIRHLDRTFGAGLGVGLLESLSRRGFVEVRRRPDAPMRLDVRLVAQQESPTG